MSENTQKLKTLNAKIEAHIKGMRLIQEEINTLIQEDQGKTKKTKKTKSAPLEFKRGGKTYRVG